eukprot:TRINITY_DN1750_c0_g1_i1.p1 TRINITY_DN1750_c0_g1~~TRINITY_DN1750_c0_g1_i1.p1  ORF type:complete len:1205 (+),score=334.88 TRINITY_DN1750_c0_g1_i1:55-3669(+)
MATRRHGWALAVLCLAVCTAAQGTSAPSASPSSPPTSAPTTSPVQSNATTADPVATQAEVNALRTDLDTTWVLTCAIFVFMMQAGFCFLESGGVRSGNAQNVIFKNVGDCCIGALWWWASGYALAFGYDDSKPKSGFIGNADFFLLTNGKFAMSRMAHWMLSFVYMTTAGTIISGAVAERIALGSYYVLVSSVSAFSYPVIVHWIWSSEGWLSATNPDTFGANGVLDFSGSIVIHMSGGVSAAVAAKIIGARCLQSGHSVFSPEGAAEVAPHNKFSCAVGTLFLWTSWFAFNAGSVVSFSSDSGVAANAALTTGISGATAAVTGLVVCLVQDGYFELCYVCNCLLSGLVAITAGCPFVSNQYAIVIGIVSVFAYSGGVKLRYFLRIDDVIDAFAVHGMNGAWGGIAVGLFADKDKVVSALSDGRNVSDYGLFLGGGGEQLGVQLLAILCVAVWSAVCMAIVSGVLSLTGTLRVSLQDEMMGLDKAEHRSSAYDYLAKMQADRDRAVVMMSSAEDVCSYLVSFDLDSAGAVIEARQAEEGGSSVGILETFSLLLKNLAVYRPYLPDTLFVTAEEEEADLPERDRMSRVSSKQSQRSCLTNRSRATSHKGTMRSVLTASRSRDDKGDKNSALGLGLKRKSVTVLDIELGDGFDVTHQESFGGIAGVMSAFTKVVQHTVKALRGSVERLGVFRVICTWNTVVSASQHQLAAARCFKQILTKMHDDDEMSALTVRAAIVSGFFHSGNVGGETVRCHLVWNKSLTTVRRLLLPLAHHIEADLLVDQATQEKIAPVYITRPVDILTVPQEYEHHFKDPTIVVHLVSAEKEDDTWQGGVADGKFNEQLYADSFAALQKGDFQRAESGFAALIEEFPEESGVQRLHRICGCKVEYKRQCLSLPVSYVDGDVVAKHPATQRPLIPPLSPPGLGASITESSPRGSSAAPSPRTVQKRIRDVLLRNMLPEAILERLQTGRDTNVVDAYDHCTVVFADMVSFTSRSSAMPPSELVKMLMEVFGAFDLLSQDADVTKIKTMGDCYMAVTGAPVRDTTGHAETALRFALNLIGLIQLYNKERSADLEMRVGMSSGPAVGGIIGKRQFCFDVWGDTVNLGAHMEATGLPGHIQMTTQTKDLLEAAPRSKALLHDPRRKLVERTVHIKGKGDVHTHCVDARGGSAASASLMQYLREAQRNPLDGALESGFRRRVSTVFGQ